MPMRGALSAPVMRNGWSAEARGSAQGGVVGSFSDRELAAVICFCATGLVASILLALSAPFPDELAGVLAQIF